MQITHAEVTPIELTLKSAVRLPGIAPIERIMALFVRIETRQGRSAWGCGVAHPALTGEQPEAALRACQASADRAIDLHPTNIEFSLAELRPLTQESPAASCAFDLAFHDLLGLAAGLPLYRLLGGFRNRIQTSITIPAIPVEECVAAALKYARQGFHVFKIKGGEDPEADIQAVRGIHRALPNHLLRLDPDGHYTTRTALDVALSVDGMIEILEQPTPAGDPGGLGKVTKISPVPVIADQSVSGPASLLELAALRIVDGISIKVATCGGLQYARQMDAIARAAQLTMMVSCIFEPALLTAAGLSFALSSPNVRYCDLDGYMGLENDPTLPGFRLEEGCLIASDVPGLGCTLEL
jgi:L-Ala-D/L-Glu epimerase